MRFWPLRLLSRSAKDAGLKGEPQQSPRVSPLSHHCVSRRGRRRHGNVCTQRRRWLRGLPWARQCLFPQGGDARQTTSQGPWTEARNAGGPASTATTTPTTSPLSTRSRLAKIAHPTKLPKSAEAQRYKTPRNLALRPDGKELYVTCEAAHTVCRRRHRDTAKNGRDPRGPSANGRHLQPRW